MEEFELLDLITRLVKKKIHVEVMISISGDEIDYELMPEGMDQNELNNDEYDFFHFELYEIMLQESLNVIMDHHKFVFDYQEEKGLGMSYTSSTISKEKHLINRHDKSDFMKNISSLFTKFYPNESVNNLHQILLINCAKYVDFENRKDITIDLNPSAAHQELQNLNPGFVGDAKALVSLHFDNLLKTEERDSIKCINNVYQIFSSGKPRNYTQQELKEIIEAY